MTHKIFPYSWHIDEQQEEITIIRIYGLNEKNQSVSVTINDFTPYIYLELPEDIEWNETRANMLGKKIDDICGKFRPLKKCLSFKKKLYYANVSQKRDTYTYQKFPFLMLSFSSPLDIKKVVYRLNKPIIVSGIGNVEVKIHEQDANAILQLVCVKDIPTAGWFYFKGTEIVGYDKETYCKHEYVVKWKNIARVKSEMKMPLPLIMGFDIEVNSTNPNAMPNAKKPGDKVFQISCVLSRPNDTDDKFRRFLLTLGSPESKIVGDNVEILTFDTECELLTGFTKFITKYNPQLIVGYNILNFDIPYMIERAKSELCMYEFDQMSCRRYHHAPEKLIKWSSSAYKNQEFQFLDAEGRLFVDLLPLVKRDYKFNNYKLKTISDFFLGETKDPLTPKGIFKCYREGMKRNKSGEYTKRARKAMSVVGKYCVQDTVLCNKLVEVLQTWVGLCEMASTCNVPIFYLYTQGQQIKVYSQVYKYCMKHNIIVEKDGYKASEDESYTGATVFPPEPGAYDKVVPFDFSSLYPTTIIAYNIDYSTLVRDDDSIPDSDCNVIEWEDHIGCQHDTQKRTVKPKTIICAHRRYRFLKEPKGVMPSLLEFLLNARKETRKEIKNIKGSLKDCDDDKKCEDMNTRITVLNKRQLAYKVSANSVGGYTPILCKKNGHIVYLTIEELSKGDWSRINHEQEVSTPIENVYVWSDKGFTKPKFVMRHPQEKPLNRVITHTGLVDCTDDHSLLSPDGTEVTPNNLKIGDDLMHYQYPLPKDTPKIPLFRTISNDTIEHYILTTKDEEINFLYGLFFAEGSCGTWGKPGKTKTSWIIYNQDKNLLTRALKILSKHFNYYGNFLISEYYESASVYHLTIRGKVKELSDKFRDMFYDNRKYKKIPDKILNDNFMNRQAFFMGYYSGDGNRNIKTGVIINNKGMRGTASLMYLANSLGYKVSISNPKNNLIFRLQCCTQFRYKNKEQKIKTIRKTYENQKISSTRSIEIRNGEKIEFSKNEAYYRNIQIICNRFPRQKLLDSLDNCILCAHNRQSYITRYNTTNKKITYKKYCCGKEVDISMRTLKLDLPENNKCNCENCVISKNNNCKTLYTENQNEYVYDIETENHHFAAGIGHMIVHNSMYGAMGVRRGYLPFLPGAMCTTAQGRKSIEKAAYEIQYNYGAKLVYGDSVTGDTPVLCRKNGEIFYCNISDLGEKSTYSNYYGDKEQIVLNGVEVWTERGFTKINKVIRHYTEKKIFQVLCHTGVVNVTEDHSLLDTNSEKISPKDIQVGSELLTHSLPKITVSRSFIFMDRKVTPEICYVMGLFYADGSCGKYECKSGKKSSWAINNSNMKLLENCKNILIKFYENINFKILDTESGVYKLVVNGTNIVYFVDQWRQYFYCKKWKQVPNEMLQESRECRQSFLDGYYAGDGDKDKNGYFRFDNKGQIGSAGLYFIANSLGYNVSINTRNDKFDIYRITCTKNNQRKKPGLIKRITEIKYDTKKYVYDLETENHHFSAGPGQLIVHNTDSAYVHFPNLKTAAEIWDYCFAVEKEMYENNVFPKPMKLEFEEVIYWRFFILTKKRYMALSCGRDGKVSDKIMKKGVLLARRDNSKFIRDIYEKVIMMIFNKSTKEDVLYEIIIFFNLLCSYSLDLENFVITKSVGETGDYKIRELPKDPIKRLKRLDDMKIPPEWEKMPPSKNQSHVYKNKLEEIYILKSLPSQVQLAEKMRRRGIRVDAGSRMEYVITDTGNIKDKVSEKIEDPEYQKKYGDIIKIDHLYYIKLTTNPLDQALYVGYKIKDYVLNQYKLRCNKYKMMEEIREMFNPRIKIEGEPEIIPKKKRATRKTTK